jgi:hypothetical protein
MWFPPKLAVLALFSVTNLVYQILHKPTEVFALIPGESNKSPVETWKQYAPLFREYSTTSISPELLAALAQVESAGNPIARTYWRWSLTSDPFAVLGKRHVDHRQTQDAHPRRCW